MDDFPQLADLIAVDDNIDYGFVCAGVVALSCHGGHAAAKDGGKLCTDLLRNGGNNHRRLRAVEALYNEIYGFQGGCIGNNGVQRENPAVHDNAADDVQQDVVDHDKRSHRDAKPFGEDYRHDFDAVHGTAKADGKTASGAGNQTAEQRTKQQVRAGKRRRDADIDGQHIGNQPCSNGVDCDSKNRVDGKRCALPFESVEEQGDVKYQQKQRQTHPVRCQLPKQHGSAGNAAVV